MTLFPEPDSPTIPKVSSRCSENDDAVDRFNDTVRRGETDLEVADLEEGLSIHALGKHKPEQGRKRPTPY